MGATEEDIIICVVAVDGMMVAVEIFIVVVTNDITVAL